MNRAERRRQQKSAVKSKILNPQEVADFSAEKLAKITGNRVESLLVWTKARDAEFEYTYNQKLSEAEDYCCMANILIAAFAINKTWGYKKAICNFIENLNEAEKIVRENGLKNSYKRAHKEFGIELEFDSDNLNKQFGLGKYAKE